LTDAEAEFRMRQTGKLDKCAGCGHERWIHSNKPERRSPDKWGKAHLTILPADTHCCWHTCNCPRWGASDVDLLLEELAL
jgi:hypothetical protein